MKVPREVRGVTVDTIVNVDSYPALFEKARRVREKHFGRGVFAYGFNYFSTHCKNKCAFCLYRQGNECAPRYRHSIDDIVRDAKSLADSGVHLIDLTMGEDPYFLKRPQTLVSMVDAVHEETKLPVMVSPGVIDAEVLPRMREAGAVWFALYQETYDREAFARLRVGQSFDSRILLKRAAARAGLLIEEGLLTGWGDSPFQIADSILAMASVHPSQVRAMTFVPQPGTPLESLLPQSSETELAMIALMRILYPDLLIPASLDVEGPAGLLARLNAGANVVTSLIPRGAGLEGVARNSSIEDGGRTLEQVMPTIRQAGLELASHSDYADFIERARSRALSDSRRPETARRR